MKRIFFLSAIIAFAGIARAQQITSYGQFFLNPYLYNPALAGTSDRTRIFSLLRNQWIGIPGAPETQVLTLDGPLVDSKVGLGITLYNDVNNILTRTGGLGTYAYHLPLAAGHRLSMGLSAGFTRTQIDFDRLRADNPFDQAILQYANNGTGLDGNVGVAYSHKTLRISGAALQLFQNRINFNSEERDKSIGYKLMRHYVVSAQYGFITRNGLMTIEPIALLRSAQGLPAQVDFNLLATYRKNYWVSVGHKLNTSVALSLGAFLHDRITVGYHYEYMTNQYAIYQSGSHEVIVGFTFKKPSGNSNPKPAQDYSMLARQYQEQFETIDQITQEKDIIANDLEEQKQIVGKQKEEIIRLQQEIQKSKKEMDSVVRVSKIDVNTENFQEAKSGALYYTVVAAFKTLKVAKEYQKVIRRELAMETSVVPKSNGSYFFIYTKQVQDREEAVSEMNRLRQIKSTLIVGEPWVYKSPK